MTRSPLVSIVLPVRFVHREWLKRSISSVLEQDYPSLELIVVNDEATEDIDALVASFGITKYVKNDRNRKLPYSLNRGFEVARGEYHTWTSADNIMLPGMIARLMQQFERQPDAAIVCGRSVIIDEHDQIVDVPPGELNTCRLSGTLVTDAYVERRYTYYGTLGACFMYRKDVWSAVGGYDENRHGSEDFDFWIKASRRFTIGRIPWHEPPLYAYRGHANSISRIVAGCYTTDRVKVLERETRLYRDDATLRRALAFYRSQRPPVGERLWTFLRALKRNLKLQLRESAQ